MTFCLITYHIYIFLSHWTRTLKQHICAPLLVSIYSVFHFLDSQVCICKLKWIKENPTQLPKGALGGLSPLCLSPNDKCVGTYRMKDEN